MTAIWQLPGFSGCIRLVKLSGFTAVESEDRLHGLLLVIKNVTLNASAMADKTDFYFFSASVHSPTRPFWMRNWCQLRNSAWYHACEPGELRSAQDEIAKQTSPGSR